MFASACPSPRTTVSSGLLKGTTWGLGYGFVVRPSLVLNELRRARSSPPYKLQIICLPSHHAVLRIIDAPMKSAGSDLPIERHGEIAEGVRRVRGPVMHRMRPQHCVLFIALGAVEGERIDATSAFLCLEPAARQHQAHRTDAVLDAMRWRQRDALEAERGQNLEPALAGAKLLGLRIVRHDVARIRVRLGGKLPHVVTEIDA